MSSIDASVAATKSEATIYADMTDDEAKEVIRQCIGRHMHGGTLIEEIRTALKTEVGIQTYVSLNFFPRPIDGRLPEPGRQGFMFQFMAYGPSGAIIS